MTYFYVILAIEVKRRITHNPGGYHLLTKDLHSQLESRANHRPGFKTCFGHRNGKRTTGRVKQPVDATDVGLRPYHKTDKKMLPAPDKGDIFVDESAPIVESNLPI